jgi:putative endonuclease
MYDVYILKSKIKDRYYIGHTNNLEKRLIEHNSGKTKSTKAYLPWEVIHTESYKTKSEAFKRELEIKSYKSGIKFHILIHPERWQSG